MGTEVEIDGQMEALGPGTELATITQHHPEPSVNAAWERYGELQLEARVTIPLHEMLVQDIRRIVPGTVFHSSHTATDDVLLTVGEVALANVSFEPAEDKLGIRINDLDACDREYSGRHQVLGLAPSAGMHLDAVSNLRMPISLCFGSKQWSLQDALALTPGDLLSLDRDLHGQVSIMARGKTIACGRLLLIEGRYAVEITEDAPPGPENEVTLQHHRGHHQPPSRVAEPGHAPHGLSRAK